MRDRKTSLGLQLRFLEVAHDSLGGCSVETAIHLCDRIILPLGKIDGSETLSQALLKSDVIEVNVGNRQQSPHSQGFIFF